jgi:hypothetical protein
MKGIQEISYKKKVPASFCFSRVSLSFSFTDVHKKPAIDSGYSLATSKMADNLGR